MTQGHLRSAKTPGGARGRPGRGARALRPALTSHLLVTLSGLRGRCDRAPSPSPPLLPGSPKLAPARSPSAIVASSATFVPSATIRSRNSGLVPPAPLALADGDPESSAHPRAPRPAGLASRPAPASLTEIRGFFQSYRLLAANPVSENTGFARCGHCLPQPIRSQQPERPGPDSLYVRGGGGRGRPQRGAHWLGRRGFPVRGGAFSSWPT